MSNYYALDLTGTETTKKDFFKNGPFRGWHFCGPIGNITGGFCGTRKGSRFHTEPTIKKGISERIWGTMEGGGILKDPQ